MIMDGKKIAEEMLVEVAEKVKTLQQVQGKPLKLVTILIGQHLGSKKFLELKGVAAKKVGIDFEMKEFPDDLPEGVLLSRVRSFIRLSTGTGILIELPLPRSYQPTPFLNAIPPEKDIDVLSEAAQKRFFSGDFTILPPAVEAVKIIFGKYKIDPRGKKIVIFGHGLLVGKPVAYWLYQQRAMVSVVDEFTKNPEQYSQAADILISGVGKAHLIGGEMIKAGAIVIDFGYCHLSTSDVDSKVVGDVDFENVKEKASLITPVPGGVGPVVIAAVLRNLLKLSLR